MQLIGAIDLLGGRARRLERGDYERPIEHSADPLVLAEHWLRGGLRWLHLVDLDGAREGRPVNAAIIAAVCRRAAQSGARVQVGGGLRDEAAVEAVLATGATYVMLGTAAIRRPAFVAECSGRWPGRIGISLDLRGGRPAVEGWRAEGAGDAQDLARQLLTAGASLLAVTDVERDGMGAGPNLELSRAFRTAFPARLLVAAGGIATAADLTALARLGLDGAIVGRALLDGSLALREALAAAAGEPVA